MYTFEIGKKTILRKRCASVRSLLKKDLLLDLFVLPRNTPRIILDERPKWFCLLKSLSIMYDAYQLSNTSTYIVYQNVSHRSRPA